VKSIGALVTGLLLVAAPARAQTGPANDSATTPATGQTQDPGQGQATTPAQPPTVGQPPAPGAYPPGDGYPPGYAYPPGYGYPPGYAYPPGYPVYPQNPPDYSAYPQYAPPPPPVPEAPSPLPATKWRLGAFLMLIPQSDFSYFSYVLKYRGEALEAHTGKTMTTAGVSAFVEYDPIKYAFLAFALQILPSFKWEPRPISSSTTDAYTGSAREFDFLPQLGATIPVSRRVRLLAFVAPGYSVLSASNLRLMYAHPENVYGFVVQTGAGVLFSVGAHVFFEFRAVGQWGFQSGDTQSPTTGESAETRFRSRLVSVQGGGGYWF
jgi:hypothetical protein